MEQAKSKLDRLHEAEVVNKHDLNDDDKKNVEQITDEEVEVLISLRQRLGPVKPGRERIKPCIPL